MIKLFSMIMLSALLCGCGTFGKIVGTVGNLTHPPEHQTDNSILANAKIAAAKNVDQSEHKTQSATVNIPKTYNSNHDTILNEGLPWWAVILIALFVPSGFSWYKMWRSYYKKTKG